MMYKNISIVSLLLGAAVFLLLHGFSIVNPTHINWIMAGDPGQHFLGFHFFRSEPWHFPLGTIERYYYPSGTCMTFMDAIPLIGIPLKLFSNILPQPFQYLGLWLLLSYMLQGLFASLLLKKFTNNWILILLGTTFFILSPIMFLRTGGHEALAGHWLILASLYLYLSSYTNKTKIKWIALIITTSLVHFYLLVMVLAIWAGYILKAILNDTTKKNIINSFIYLAFTMFLLLLSMWVIGYFTISVSDGGTGGFGFYSMNILAPFNPAGGGETTFLNKIQLATRGQGEGYNYLGLGLLILIIFALLKVPQVIKSMNFKTVFPIVIVLLLLFIFSLSNKVTFGNTILIKFQYPWILEDIGRLLRASGRMFWPVYYALMFISISIVIKYYKPQKSLFILLTLLVIQIIDFYPWYSSINLNNRTYTTSLKSEQWKKIAQSVKHIVIIPPSGTTKKYDFALFAANNRLTIDTGYVARTNKQKRYKYEDNLLKRFKAGKLDSETLYIIKDKNYMFIPIDLTKFSTGILDNYNIIIPKNNNIILKKIRLDIKKIPFKSVVFNSKNLGFIGWSHSEKNHRWSLGKESCIIAGKISNMANIKGLLTLNLGTLGNQEVILYINNKQIGKQTIEGWKKTVQFQFSPDILHKNNLNYIKFKFPNAHKPKNNDSRVLAIALRTISIE